MELARDLALEMQAEGKGLVLNQVQEASIPANAAKFLADRSHIGLEIFRDSTLQAHFPGLFSPCGC